MLNFRWSFVSIEHKFQKIESIPYEFFFWLAKKGKKSANQSVVGLIDFINFRRVEREENKSQFSIIFLETHKDQSRHEVTNNEADTFNCKTLLFSLLDREA